MSRHGSPSHERLRWAIEQRHARLALLAAADLPRIPPRDALELSLLLLDAEARRGDAVAAGEGPRRPVVLVAGDEPLLVRGAALLLDRAQDIDAIYVGSASRARRFMSSGAEVVAWAGGHLDESALESLRELREQFPRTGLCLLARRADEAGLKRLVGQSADRFALAFHAERLDARDFVDMIRTVLRGRSTFDAALLRQLSSDPHEEEDLELTQSERDVMELVASGLRNREIGRRLWKSEKAVEKQVGRLFQKLGLPAGSTGHLDRRVAATRIYLARQAARQHGVVSRQQFEPPAPAGS
ncbi:MAG TPA: response regulator transcription factor [Thermoleophilaceae bacterium]